ncbi:MAG: hypothetical protein HQK87_01780 [Nitrospinae bacterium]|nr:hypothetical protein [Nitrospinota bacterium]
MGRLKKGLKRALLWGVRGVAAVLLLAIGAVLIKAYHFLAPIDPIPFDPAGWRAPVDLYDRNTPRSRMVDHLLTRLTPGIKRRIVVEGLGPPDQTGDTCDYWRLGFRGDFIDPSSLRLCYEEGLLVESRIYRH